MKWFTAAVWALVLASFLALPVLWNSQAAAQQTESKPAAPDKTAASTASETGALPAHEPAADEHVGDERRTEQPVAGHSRDRIELRVASRGDVALHR